MNSLDVLRVLNRTSSALLRTQSLWTTWATVGRDSAIRTCSALGEVILPLVVNQFGTWAITASNAFGEGVDGLKTYTLAQSGQELIGRTIVEAHLLAINDARCCSAMIAGGAFPVHLHPEGKSPAINETHIDVVTTQLRRFITWLSRLPKCCFKLCIYRRGTDSVITIADAFFARATAASKTTFVPLCIAKHFGPISRCRQTIRC
mmetsp:Transcript_88260/g.175380  ORF Transcript_88260/g.175380 Transcript_88260/m.175380 type:complete len:205 (-) Transcript_88260:252-866(-)